MYHTDNKDHLVKRVCQAAYPNYRGRTIKINYTESVNMASYWDGGSRDYFEIVRLSDCQCMSIPAQSAFDIRLEGVDNFTIPEGFVVVEHSIFCGKDLGLTIHARPDGSLTLDKPKDVLSEIEINVLRATAGLKSSYAGISDLRAHELKRKYNYTQAEVDNARRSLIDKGLMTKNKAINNAGRNAIEGMKYF